MHASANVHSNIRIETSGRKREELREKEREREEEGKGKDILLERQRRKQRACASYVARICGVRPNIPHLCGYCAHSPFTSSPPEENPGTCRQRNAKPEIHFIPGVIATAITRP